MDCRLQENLLDCTCGNADCPRKGRCCECVARHRARNQLPGCLMPEELRDHSRSAEDLARFYARG